MRLLADIVPVATVLDTIRDSARVTLAVSLPRLGYHLTIAEMAELVDELARNLAQSVIGIDLDAGEQEPDDEMGEGYLDGWEKHMNAGGHMSEQGARSLIASLRRARAELAAPLPPARTAHEIIEEFGAAAVVDRLEAAERYWVGRELERQAIDAGLCSACGLPAHASETDDHGRCIECIKAAGETPIFPDNDRPSAGPGTVPAHDNHQE